MSLSRLCRWLGVPRHSLYDRPRGRGRPLDPDEVRAFRAVIERFPGYGYRRVAAVPGWNRKVVQRICQRRGWQARKRPKGHRPRALLTRRWGGGWPAPAMPRRPRRHRERAGRAVHPRLKEECVWQHRLENLPHARQMLGAWIHYYHTERSHQALGH